MHLLIENIILKNTTQQCKTIRFWQQVAYIAFMFQEYVF